MRKFLLASVAVMGSSVGFAGYAAAQTAPALPIAPLSGGLVVAPDGATAANNNNN
jgi:hypothetical protein